MILISGLAPFLTARRQYRRKFVANRIQIYSHRGGMFMREPGPSSIQVSTFKSGEPLLRLNVNSFRAARGTLQGERADFSIIPFISISSRQALSVSLFSSLLFACEPFPHVKGNQLKSVNRGSNTSALWDTKSLYAVHFLCSSAGMMMDVVFHATACKRSHYGWVNLAGFLYEIDGAAILLVDRRI